MSALAVPTDADELEQIVGDNWNLLEGITSAEMVPVVLGAREMDALETIVADYAAYRILLVPTMVPPG